MVRKFINIACMSVVFCSIVLVSITGLSETVSVPMDPGQMDEIFQMVGSEYYTRSYKLKMYAIALFAAALALAPYAFRRTREILMAPPSNAKAETKARPPSRGRGKKRVIATQEREIERLRGDLERLDRALEESHVSLGVARREGKKRIEGKEAEIKRLDAENLNLTEKKDAEISRLRDRIRQGEKALETEKARIGAEYELKMAALLRKARRAELEIAGKEAEIGKLGVEIEALKDKIARREKELAAENARIGAESELKAEKLLSRIRQGELEIAGKEAEIGKLGVEIESLRDGMRRRGRELEAENARLNAESELKMGELLAKVRRGERDIEGKETEIGKLGVEIRALRKKMRRRERELSEEKARASAAAELKTGELLKKVRRGEREIAKKEAEIQSLSSEIMDLRDRMGRREIQLIEERDKEVAEQELKTEKLVDEIRREGERAIAEKEAEIETLLAKEIRDQRARMVDERTDARTRLAENGVGECHLALCGDFGWIRELDGAASGMRLYPRQAGGGSRSSLDEKIDVVLLDGARLRKYKKMLCKLDRPVLIATDRKETRIESHEAFENLAVSYILPEELKNMELLSGAVQALGDVEKATRIRSGAERFLTNHGKLIDTLAEIEEEYTHPKIHPPCHIPGETGVGKKLVVDYIAKKAGMGLVTVNCANLPDELYASMMFGHKKGSYTSADTDEKGFFQKLEEKGGQILFLDEIDKMSPVVQAGMLNAIPEGNYRPVGEARVRKVVLVLVTATNRDLKDMVVRGEFLKDMFYRIRELSFPIPPLFERPEDILPISHYYLGKSIGRTGKYVRASEMFMKRLQALRLAGNVRDLKTIIEQAVNRSRDGDTLKNLPVLDNLKGESLNPRLELMEMEKAIIQKSLDLSGWKFSKAEKISGYSSRTLRRKAAHYGLVNPGKKNSQ